MGFNKSIRFLGILAAILPGVTGFVGRTAAQISVSPASPTIRLGNTLQFDAMSKTQLPLQGAKSVASGGALTCALMLDGTVKCWGANVNGELGVGKTYESSAVPVTVTGLNHVIAIAVGSLHACALIADGTMKCWGYNYYGQLGNGSTTDAYSPTLVKGLQGPVVGIATGMDHTCAIVLGGSVQCWGYNFYLQLGNSNINNAPLPVQVSGLGFVTAIAAGDYHTCALEASGNVYCWGEGLSGQLGDGLMKNCIGLQCQDGGNSSSPVQSEVSAVKAIAAAGSHTCALVDYSGDVLCWGDIANNALVPTYMPVSGAKAIATGETHACALLASGTMECWGQNGDGQLGDGYYTASSSPVAVSSLNGAASVAAGNYQTYAVLSNGSVMFWGLQVGAVGPSGGIVTSSTPKLVQGNYLPKQGVQQLITGAQDTCALMGDGSVECWGTNGNGQIGSGNTQPSVNPVVVAGLSNAIAAGVGAEHVCALIADGSVQCWGDNSFGEIPGCPSTTCLQPSVIAGVQGAIAIAAGGFHTCALIVDGTVNCWGENTSVSASQCTPANCYKGPVAGVSQAIAITAGFTHSCASFANGEVTCWGQTSGSGGPQVGPTLVPNTGGWETWVTSLAAGNAFTCAVVVDGSALCWGANNVHGELGDNSTTASAVPVLVSNLTTAKTITAGFDSPCAVTANGSLVCWGLNMFGELGNGTTSNSGVPVSITGISAAAGASSGLFTNSALLADGTVQDWGDGASGGLGNGTTNVSLTPVPTKPLVSILWSSNNPSLVSINPSTGLATGIATGATTVQVIDSGQSASTGVSVF